MTSGGLLLRCERERPQAPRSCFLTSTRGVAETETGAPCGREGEDLGGGRMGVDPGHTSEVHSFIRARCLNGVQHLPPPALAPAKR